MESQMENQIVLIVKLKFAEMDARIFLIEKHIIQIQQDMIVEMKIIG